MKIENNIPTQEPSIEKSPDIEIRDNGNNIFIPGDAELALKIFVALDPSQKSSVEAKKDEYISDLKNKEELRPAGTFAINLDNGKIWVNNRNGYGIKANIDQMLEAVKSVLE